MFPETATSPELDIDPTNCEILDADNEVVNIPAAVIEPVLATVPPNTALPTAAITPELDTGPRRAIPASPVIVTVSPKISIGEPPDIALAVSDVSVALDAEIVEEPLNSTLPVNVIEDAEILIGEPPTI
tara:strand:- start:149 stop:535 length:387 start_codon:yes stop_codon:yes gene_type:complete